MISSMRAANYRDEVLQVIDTYIHEEKGDNQKSAGVQRAKALKHYIKWQLLGVEKLTDRQLMWRMLDYIRMQHGTGPLQTSSKLRWSLLESLGLYAYCKNLQGVEMTAVVDLIQQNLKKTYCYDDKSANELVKQITDILGEYIAKESDSFFRKSNCIEAEALQEAIHTQWVLHENLNEQQILWRLYEQLKMPEGEGIFAGNTSLRSNMLSMLCSYLLCDNNAIAAEVNMRTGHSYFKHSWFGPVFIPALDGGIYYDVRCNHLLRKLVERSPMLAHPHEMRPFITYG